MRKRKWLTPLVVIVVLSSLAVSLGMVNSQTDETSYVDEWAFLDIVEHPERPNITSEWLDRVYPDRDWGGTKDEEWERAVFEAPYWINPPLAAYLSYPLTRLTTDMHQLRILSIALFLASICLIFLAIRKDGYKKSSLICLSVILLVTYFSDGAVKFYYNAFVGFFFALSWYLVVRGSKWKYPQQ